VLRRPRSIYLDLPSSRRRWSNAGYGGRRKPGLRQFGYLLLILALLVIGGGVAQLLRGLPAQHIRVTFASDVVASGTGVPMPWPRQGQAALAVDGIGSVGASGPTTPVPIASLAKMMTAYQILKDHPLARSSDGSSLTVDAAGVADYRARSAQRQSVLAVRAGERLTERQALQALLIASANNVAVLVARWDAGSVSSFVARMNATARRLGLSHTHYTDPDGIAAATVSTAADQLTLAQAVMRAPVFADIVLQPAATFPIAGRIFNYDYLVGHNGVIGIKTGSDAAAGGCWAFAARRVLAGKQTVVYGVVLGQRAPKTGELIQPALDLGLRLADAVGRAVRPAQLVAAGTVTGSLQAPWRSDVPLVTQQPLTLVSVPGAHYAAHVRLRVPHQTSIKAGTVVGELEIGGVTTSVIVAYAATAPTSRWRLTRL
jgi:D-alanyl-D-alanine carboxypeptidase (penicillin-binding protein 5/6)